MMRWKRQSRSKGASTIEYAALVTMILVAFWFGLRGYIQRGIWGKWKSAGDTFGQGRQYEPIGTPAVGRTEECFFDERIGQWVDLACFESSCNCTLESDDAGYAAACLQCMATCNCLL